MQQTFIPESFNSAPGVVMSSSGVEKANILPTIPNINTWCTSSSNSPQTSHTYRLQSEIQSVEQYPNKYFYGNHKPFVPVTGSIPTNASPNLGYQFSSPPLTEHYEKSPTASEAGISMASNITNNIPNIYPQKPRYFPSMTPVDRSITSFMNALPQQISKAPVRADPYSPLAKSPDSMRLDPKIHSSLHNFRCQSLFQPSDQYSVLPEIQQDSKIKSTYESFHVSTFTRPSNEFNLSPDLRKSFAKLGPIIGKIGSRNYSSILVEVLRQFHLHISLDEFYRLLYKQEPFVEAIPNANTTITDPTSSKLKALNILHLVLVTFQYPQFTIGLLPDESIQKLSVSATKFQEILRTLLAIKIILTAVKKVDFPLISQFAVSRATVYKVYYILCRKLAAKYPILSTYDEFPETLTLGQVRIGKLTNLIYPNMNMKRLGKRGHSKAHYIGLALNYSMIDPDTRRLLDLDLVQLREYFSGKKKNTEIHIQNYQGDQRGDLDVKPNFSSLSH